MEMRDAKKPQLWQKVSRNKTHVFVSGGGGGGLWGQGENRVSQKQCPWKRSGVQCPVQGQTDTDGHMAGFFSEKRWLLLAGVPGSSSGHLQVRELKSDDLTCHCTT